MTTYLGLKFLSILIIFLLNGQGIGAGVMHTHTSEIHKEHESHGAYSPRDRSHVNEINSNEHHRIFDHEAIIGSYSEAEEFDSLPPEKAKERLALLLKKMDLNADKYIDKSELKAWIIRSFRMLAEEEAADRLEDVDVNHDGLVTWEEYRTDTFESDELPTSNVVEEEKSFWEAADVNKDGKLDIKEFTIFTHPEEHPSMLPIFLDQTLKDKDKDNDKSIDFQEFIGTNAKDHDKHWLTEQKSSFDNDLDKDKDGKLTGDEILSWIVPSNTEIAEEEVDHLFEESDDDHDGLLSFEEVIKHYDTFVGSEATDYGDHLLKPHHYSDEL